MDTLFFFCVSKIWTRVLSSYLQRIQNNKSDERETTKYNMRTRTPSANKNAHAASPSLTVLHDVRESPFALKKRYCGYVIFSSVFRKSRRASSPLTCKGYKRTNLTKPKRRNMIRELAHPVQTETHTQRRRHQPCFMI